MEPNEAVNGFSGRLENFPLLDVIQMACVARRDGRLDIKHNTERGRVLLKRGQIVYVKTERLTGEDALLEILCWTTGEFIFSAMRLGGWPQQNVEGSWEHLLMEAVRKRDELHGSNGAVGRTWLPQRLRPELTSQLLGEIGRQRFRVAFLRRLLQIVGVLLAAVAIAAVAMLVTRLGPPLLSVFVQPNQQDSRHWTKNQQYQVQIPGGEFIYQDGQTRRVGTYNIDATEITVWQYADFLKAIGNRTDFDHPAQPRSKLHTNPDWEAYSRAAFALDRFRGVVVTPNFPAVFIDWYDAYAFSKWKGRHLPTEEQWEKAARGQKGLRYPWGDNFELGAANLLGSGRQILGWTAVGSWPRDRSQYGVFDMAGNVSEWTGSWAENGNPVVRGGNFSNTEAEIARRIINVSPETIDSRIGFRTAGDGSEVMSH
jgi:formylglycine-generating enzyme required for sulfatase activity